MILPAGHEPAVIVLQPPDDDADPAAVAPVPDRERLDNGRAVRPQRLPGRRPAVDLRLELALRSGAQGAGLVE